MADDLSQFKARLPVVEIVQHFVRLTRAGPLWKGLCPFHQEKTPSFTVTESRGSFHCFGCGKHGNALDFLIEIEGLTFADAVRRAADLTGIEPPRLGHDDGEAERGSLDDLRAVLETACALFREALTTSSGAAAHAYILERRRLRPETVERFELGYADAGRSSLTRALQARGASIETLAAAGLTVMPDDGGEPYDRFRDRLTFPIRDARGKLAGFGGRALREDVGAKYLNSPEGPLFKKRELLYGVHLLDRRTGRGSLHLVEGYMDVIALAEHGIAAVAPLGTAVTAEQLAQAWRLETAPVVCLDGDEAGQRAAGRLAELAAPVLRPGLTLRFATVPAGDDPDSLVRRGGREALLETTAAALPLADVLWRHVGETGTPAGPEARALVRRRLRELVASIADADVRREYVREFQERLGDRVSGDLGVRRRSVLEQPGRTLMAGQADVELGRARAILAPLLLAPELLARFDEAVGALQFADARLERLKECLLDFAASEQPLEADAIRTHIQRVGLGELAAEVVRNVPRPTFRGSLIDHQAELYGAALERDRHGHSGRAEQELFAEALLVGVENGSGEISSRAVGVDSLINNRRPGSDDRV